MPHTIEGVTVRKVSGRCAHAYAVRRRTALKLIEHTDTTHDRQRNAYMDARICNVAQDLHGFYATGLNLASPGDAKMRGVFFQDRARFSPGISTWATPRAAPNSSVKSSSAQSSTVLKRMARDGHG